MRQPKRQPAECPKCGGDTVLLRTFYGRPVQVVEGPHAGQYPVYCEACGFRGGVSADDAHLVKLGRGDGFAGML